ncbi:MAG: bacteriophage Gp15 family protein [Clostridiales bacterium]|nr:bacteriophage Gp15 family protein [Clostridiales bacterium]
MTYPEYVRIAGEKVKIKTDYRVALKALKVANDSTIGDYERALAVVYIMYGYLPPEEQFGDYLDMASKFLQCGKSAGETVTVDRDMDLNEDETYISASFLSCYHIDLTAVKHMHFWRFCELITGFDDKCIMSRVREIRTCDPNEYAEKDRHAIYRAKELLALPEKYTKEELKMIDEFEALFNTGGEK